MLQASSYKFLETRHMIYKSEPTPAAAMTIPFTISSPAATVGSLRVGLTSPPPPQPPPSSFTPQPTASISVVPSQSSPPSHSIPSTNSDTNQLSIETEPVYSNPDKANAVQGSRRRKATTPSLPGGRLRAHVCLVIDPASSQHTQLWRQLCPHSPSPSRRCSHHQARYVHINTVRSNARARVNTRVKCVRACALRTDTRERSDRAMTVTAEVRGDWWGKETPSAGGGSGGGERVGCTAPDSLPDGAVAFSGNSPVHSRRKPPKKTWRIAVRKRISTRAPARTLQRLVGRPQASDCKLKQLSHHTDVCAKVAPSVLTSRALVPESPSGPVAIERGTRINGKLRALALTVNGDAEDLVEQMCKKRKLEPPMVNGEVQQAATHIRPHSAMVCNVNDLVEVLKCQHAQQQQQQQHAANAMGEVDEVSNTTPKVTTAIMMDANSAKNLVTQLLAAAAAGQGRIELGGTAPLPLSGEQALDMSVRPAVDPQQPLQTQVKTAELKLADLIQADQLQSSTTSGLDSLRSALMAQLTGAVFPPPAGVQQITIGLPSAQPQSTPSFDITKAEANPVKQVSTSQLVNFSQLQALISALANVKSSNPPKDPLHEAISSQMLLHPASSLITSTTSTATPLVAAAVDGLNSGAISFSSAGLALASALAPPTTANSLKGISLPTGEFIPVANLMPGQPTGLGSFTFTNCTPPNSLANFVTSLGGAPVPTSASTPIHRFSAETSSTIQQRAAQPTQPHPAQLPFEAALFATAAAAAAGNPLNIVAQPALQFRTPASTQAQSINGSVAPVTVVSSVSRNETSPLLISQPLREVTSCASLEEVGGGTDTDTSLTTGLEGEEVGEEVTLGSHPEIDESGSPLSTTGIRKLSKSNRRSSSGLGTRPHRQNFTALQNRILTDWYNSHHYKPYPSTEDTKMLAQKSELTYSQVKKWFANKRARTSNNGLPKPMPPTAPDTPSTTASDTSAFVAAAVAAAAAANQPTVLSNGNSVVQSPASSIIVPSGLMIRPAGATLAATLGNSGLTILAPRPPPPPPPPPQPTQTLPATSGTEFHTSEEASAHHSPEVSKEDNSDPPALTSSPSSPTNEKQSTGNVSASSPTSSSPVIKEETN
ncbi:unnamed protein product [Mesocestoides corti]|uniref:Homeobox domain-containing protein n=2 Tax=Mesocestoides corti TaxID=53468 RepID=A0A158QT04_MESCO|nr:unnamed protein product [Mesocestoides corti]